MSAGKITVAKHRLGYAIELPNIWAADVLVTHDEARDLTAALVAAQASGPMPSLAPAEEMQRRAAAICGLRGSEADRPAPKGSQRDEIGEALLRAWCEGLASRSAADGSGIDWEALLRALVTAIDSVAFSTMAPVHVAVPLLNARTALDHAALVSSATPKEKP